MAERVSIIISNRNDVEMLSVTVASCLEALVPIPNSDIIICDNSDYEVWEAVVQVINTKYITSGKVKFLRQEEPCLFTAREAAIMSSLAEYIICLDSHMLVGYNTFWDLYKFMENHDTRKVAFAHAPITWCHRHISHAVHDRDVSISELGPWGYAYHLPRTITWKGMPWICRRDFFLNELNGYGALAEHSLSWGGGDMLIGTKPWLLGYENWAVPTRPCTHIGPFPEDSKGATGYKYRVYSNSGNNVNTLGFLVACYVLGGEPMMERNAPFLEERFKLDTKKLWEESIEYGKNERKWLLANQVMSYDDYIKNQPWKERLKLAI